MGGQGRPVTAPLGITLSVTAGNGDSTWILLHGSDGRETDLLPIVDRVRPGCGRIALRGAVRTELGYAFFDRRPDRTFDDDEVAARVDPLAEAIGLGLRITRRAGRVTILGFSNGAVMAAALLERRPDLFTGGVLLRPQPPFRAEPPRSGAVLPVLVVDGQADERRSREDGARTAERLRQAGAVVEQLTLAVGHGITADDEQAIRDWLDGTSESTRGTSPVPQRRMNASTDDREGAAMSDTSNSQPEDITVPTNDEDGTAKSGGLGDDSTIPNHPDGVAAGFSETDSHFNPEEDPEHE